MKRWRAGRHDGMLASFDRDISTMLRQTLLCLLLAAPLGGGIAQATGTGHDSPGREDALSPAQADLPPAVPRPVLPDGQTWTTPPQQPELSAAWMLGAEKDLGTYVLRVRLGAGGRIPVHAHPDERVTTVLSGTLHVGFGTIFDETRMVAIPTGAVYVVPADQPHYLLARDGDVEYQESGFGPTGSEFGRH